MRLFVSIMAVLLILGAGNVFSHEHWITAEDFFPAVGTTGSVYICSGHSFPDSHVVLKDRVLHNTQIIEPGGEHVSYGTVAKDQHRAGSLVYKAEGVHMLLFELRQPQMKESLYWAKAIIVSGNRDDTQAYRVGEGLEIVPGGKLSVLRKDDTITFVVRYNGKPVKSRLSIFPEQGKNVSLSTTGERPARFTVSHTGCHLVTAGYKGKHCSLTFSVRDTGGEP